MFSAMNSFCFEDNSCYSAGVCKFVALELRAHCVRFLSDGQPLSASENYYTWVAGRRLCLTASPRRRWGPAINQRDLRADRTPVHVRIYAKCTAHKLG